MQKEQLKRPYFPPEITAVEFRVEVGQQASLETYNGNGVMGFNRTVEEMELMIFLSSQQNSSGARMFGDPLTESGGYFNSSGTVDGSGYFF